MSESTEMDARIRQAAGRAPASPTGLLEGNDKASDAQIAAARTAGVPVAHAHRLRGEGDALAADARELAMQIATSDGMDARIRRAAGRAA